MTFVAPSLSALVVAHNEAGQLGSCLANLVFADEVVVVLDRSTDASRAIALSYGAKLVEGSWPIEGERRQAGQGACKSNWILEIDADERVPQALEVEIKNQLISRSLNIDGPDWWPIPFDNYVGNRLLRYGWGAQFGVGSKAILYKNGIKSWGKQRVHPKVQMRGQAGKVFNHRVIHRVDHNISDMLYRLDRYTTLHAQDLVDSGEIGSLRKNTLRVFGRFWKCFVRRHGYREGGLGLVIAIFAGLYPLISYLKAKYDILGE